ncbi:MAG TPA: extracellular solute-binding protein [Candidatus Mediterraneibacter colneyensis]|nr:extracellular solute-binding protein [Candidatus Mediterraneibacter colneyensis]
MKRQISQLTGIILSFALLAAGCTGGAGGTAEDDGRGEGVSDPAAIAAEWDEAAHTPLGKYPKTVEYTLGKISGANNSNLPVGDTYENNAYTRYLREVLNIQNNDVFELEADGSYEEALEMSIADRSIPDVLVVSGRDNLETLVEAGLVEDLTTVYEECTTDAIKEMYASYGEELLGSATFDGKLYAFPNTAIDDGHMLLWLRADWIEELGLEEPRSMDEAMQVIKAFVDNDIAGNGQTIGLACSTGIIAGSSETYGVDGIFTKFGSAPEKWVLDDNGGIVYGSVASETKEALRYLNQLYEDGILDSRFLLRKTDNIDDLLINGCCGAVFGRWWAPNNPLSLSYSADNTAEWKPYLFAEDVENQAQTFESYDEWMYVVVRKGFEHPEIVGKYVSAIFDYARYEDDQYAAEVNEYFAINVDPTARPMNINVDYVDALYRCGENLEKALAGEMSVTELSGLEKSYYTTCQSYLSGNLTTANGWAAYASRIQAVEVLNSAGTRKKPAISMGSVDGEIPQNLQDLETEAFLKIIAGEEPVDYFDTFVQQWYDEGGRELTESVRDGYRQIGE